MTLEQPSVVVVDDEPQFVRLLGQLLLKDFRVVTFINSADALEHLNNEEADILLTDLIMPGMDGLELIAAARRARPGLRTVLISGARPVWPTPPPDVDAFLPKPVTAHELVDCLNDVLAK